MGKLTAGAAGLEAALLHAELTLPDGSDPWREVAEAQGIKLHDVSTSAIKEHLANSQLVSLYSAWDAFLRELRADVRELSGKEWIEPTGDTPFQAIARNASVSQAMFNQTIGVDRRTALEYYRLARNAIVHPSEKASQTVDDFFDSNSQSLGSCRLQYEMQTAPARRREFSFHDVKLLSRLCLDVGDVLGTVFDPGNERLAALVPNDVWRRFAQQSRGPERMQGYLRTRWGLESSRAADIVALLSAH